MCQTKNLNYFSGIYRFPAILGDDNDASLQRRSSSLLLKSAGMFLLLQKKFISWVAPLRFANPLAPWLSPTVMPPSSTSTRGQSIELKITDQVVLLIDEARQLEKDANTHSPLYGGGEENRAPPWEKLQQSAEKYKEAGSSLKKYVRKISRQDSTGSDRSDDSAEKIDLLINMIKDYETRGQSIEKRIIIDKALLLIDEARQLEKDARALSPPLWWRGGESRALLAEAAAVRSQVQGRCIQPQELREKNQ